MHLALAIFDMIVRLALVSDTNVSELRKHYAIEKQKEIQIENNMENQQNQTEDQMESQMENETEKEPESESEQQTYTDDLDGASVGSIFI